MSNKFEKWIEQYSWENCKLRDDKYGKFLSQYLRNQPSSLVLNLRGGWGMGKTHFLKQLYVDLRFTHNYPCIYIDAWSSDYTNDPLLVLVSELLEQLQKLNKNLNASEEEKKIFEVVGKLATKAWNLSAIGVGTYLSYKMDNTAVVELFKELQIEEDTPRNIGKKLNDNYKAQRSAIEDTKFTLNKIVNYFNEDKRKVFVFVDELDRCRPTYAIEMLETIKHFFDLDNYIFVVATDTKQLGSAVQAVYGSKFDSDEYLSKFFSRVAELPQPNIGDYLSSIVSSKECEFLEKNGYTLISRGNKANDIICSVGKICHAYGISLRRVEQIWTKFISILSYHAEDKDLSLLLDAKLLFQMLVEYEIPKYASIYNARKKHIVAFQELLVGVYPQISSEYFENSERHPLDYIAEQNAKGLEPSLRLLPADLTVTWELLVHVINNNNPFHMESHKHINDYFMANRDSIFSNVEDHQIAEFISNFRHSNSTGITAYIGFYFNAIELYSHIS